MNKQLKCQLLCQLKIVRQNHFALVPDSWSLDKGKENTRKRKYKERKYKEKKIQGKENIGHKIK